MSENSGRPGMKWARWHAGNSAYSINVQRAEVDHHAKLLLDDERRALVRAALTGRVDGYSDVELAMWSCDLADAVLARYDEEVEGE